MADTPQTPTREIFNAATQKLEEASLSVDQNNEIVATFGDGHFLKFPPGLTKEQFDTAIENVQKANEGQVVITPEMEAAVQEERNNSLALIGAEPETTNASTPTGDDAPVAPEGATTNGPETTPPTE